MYAIATALFERPANVFFLERHDGAGLGNRHRRHILGGFQQLREYPLALKIRILKTDPLSNRKGGSGAADNCADQQDS